MDYFALFIIYFLKKVLRNNLWKKKTNKQTPREINLSINETQNIARNLFYTTIHRSKVNRELMQRRRRWRQQERQKTIGLDWQNTNIAHASRLLYISLPSLHDYDVKLPNYFTFCREPEHQTTTSLFFFWTLIQSFKIDLQKNSATSDELNEME